MRIFPWKIPPHPRKIDPRTIGPSANVPPDSSHLGQLPLDNSPGQFQPRTIVLPPDSYTRTVTA